MKKIIMAALVVLSAWGCAGRKAGISGIPSGPSFELAFSEAEGLAARGCYIPLKKACAVYGDLYARPAFRDKVAWPYFRTCLLLSVRQRELCILDREYLLIASRILDDVPRLVGYRSFIKMTEVLGPLSSTRGIDVDRAEDDSWIEIHTSLDREKESLRQAALGDEFLAYVFMTWRRVFSWDFDQAVDSDAFIKAHPSSLFLKYKLAISGEAMNGAVLEEIAAADPDFFEARFHLGELRIKQSRVVGAEKEFLAAYAGIPESPQIQILLASIYLITEEFDKALDFYDGTLRLAPGYRDAILGKALCLGYMGHHEEALAVLQRILDLGAYMIGESYYWMAWNLQALGRFEEGIVPIDESKKRLPMNSEVFSLAGSLGAAIGRMDRAEKDFLEALVYNKSNVEALLGMARVTQEKKLWKDSGAWCENAASAIKASMAAVDAKILELRDSDLSESRKTALIGRKTAQRESLRLQEASVKLQGASCYWNAGDAGKARALAIGASEHPSLKLKADELIKKMAPGGR